MTLARSAPLGSAGSAPPSPVPEDRARHDLGLVTSPLEPLRWIVPAGGPRVRVKRDDALGMAGGGNKLRKLEFLLGDAVSQGADVVVTAGAVQSNHARLTAAACARAGLECELLLNRRVPSRPEAYERSGNLLLDRLLGARVTLLDSCVDAEEASRERAGALREAGRRPYVIPVGGSNAVGTLGYVQAAEEILAQGAHVDGIVVAASSGGTLAGLAVGLAGAGWAGQLLGIAVSEPAEATLRRVERLAAGTCGALGRAPRAAPFTVDDAFAGPGYGLPTGAGVDAVRSAARLEGLLLDPVYTGKAFAGLLRHLGEGGLLAGCRDVVFLHTGGWPALFAYEEEFA